MMAEEHLDGPWLSPCGKVYAIYVRLEWHVDGCELCHDRLGLRWPPPDPDWPPPWLGWDA